MYDQEMFEIMIRDFLADHSPEYDDLAIGDVKFVDGHWEADAADATTVYTLTDDGTGNISVSYVGSR